MLKKDAETQAGIPWAMHLQAIAVEEPNCLICKLTGAVVGCGGWVLSGGASDSGMIELHFEFERHACEDVYSRLVGGGVELTRASHLWFTELCQCTRSSGRDLSSEIVSVNLQIETFPIAPRCPVRAV